MTSNTSNETVTTIMTDDNVPITIVQHSSGYEPPEETKIAPAEAHDGWFIAEPQSFPRKKKVIVKRKNHLYFGEFFKTTDGKVYVIVDGGTNSIPRVIDLWRPIPEDWGNLDTPTHVDQGFQWRMSPKTILDGNRFNRMKDYIDVFAVTPEGTHRVKDIQKHTKAYSAEHFCLIYLTDDVVLPDIDLNEVCLTIRPKSGLTRRRFNHIISVFGRPINSF